MGKTCYDNIIMKLLYKKSMFLLYAFLAFFVPLTFVTFTQENFEFPKMSLIYLIGTFVVTLYLIGCVLNIEETRISLGFKNFLFVLPFLLIYIVSTILSTDIYTSVWGYYSRFMGLFSLLVLVALSYIAFLIFKKEDFINLFVLTLFSTFLISMYGIFQHYGILGAATLDRVYSTLGQPNWLAQYLIMFLPVILCLYATDKLVFSPLIRGLLLILYIVVFTCFWFTFSLSGFLGFIIALLFLPKGNVKRHIVVVLISAFIMLSNFGFFSNRIHDAYIDAKKFISENFTVYAQDEYMLSDPGFIRKELWKSSLILFKSSPKNILIGIGPQTFPYEYQSFRSPILNYSSEWSYVVNRPHNYYVEVLVEMGVFGLISYSILISSIFRKSPQYLKPPLVGFYITNIFGWPVVATNLMFWLFVSYIISSNLSKDS